VKTPNEIEGAIPTALGIIHIYERQNYGAPAIYATGEHAESIRRLTVRKTLTHGDIKALKALGFTFEVILDPQSTAGSLAALVA